jgi:hypothetical protein
MIVLLRVPLLMLVHPSDKDESRADPDKTANPNVSGEIHTERIAIIEKIASLKRNPLKNIVVVADPGKVANQTVLLHHMTQAWTNQEEAVVVLVPAREISHVVLDQNVLHHQANRWRRLEQPRVQQRLVVMEPSLLKGLVQELMVQRVKKIQLLLLNRHPNKRPRHPK